MDYTFYYFIREKIGKGEGLKFNFHYIDMRVTFGCIDQSFE